MFRLVYVGFLGGLWMLLSGHTEWYMLSLGVISIAAVLLLVNRMGLVDEEGFPIHMLTRVPAYWAWLMGQIIQSNISVAKLILNPKLTINPLHIRVSASQAGDAGKVCYANSITLTPGTIATGIDGDLIRVHALTHEAGQDLGEGDMDRHVSHLESGS